MSKLSRRDFLASSIVTMGAALVGPSLWRRAIAAPARTAPSPYGALLPPDANGLRLPEGFTSRVLARSGTPVLPTTYVWHVFPDGGHVFTTDDGWIYVSNSEVPNGLGGVGALRFDSSGEIVDAYAVATGTSSNCAGGPTPWDTWLTCEEHDGGNVLECDPFGVDPAVRHTSMGTFSHESAAVDPKHRHVYLTEDETDGRLYRFTPSAYPDLSAGALEVARVHDIAAVAKGGRSDVSWLDLPDPSAASTPTRLQVAASTPFNGGEGTWFDAGIVYFTTKGDNRVWAYDTDAEQIELAYDDGLTPSPPLQGVDNLFMSDAGDLYVAEDGGDLQIVMITPDGTVGPVLQVTGTEHSGSEIAGPALNPAHDRLYFSSQRAFGPGMTFEVSGPFRKTAAGPAAPATASPASAPADVGDRDVVLPATGPGAPTLAGLGAAAAALAARHAMRGRDESG